jgi:hypothetical protein
MTDETPNQPKEMQLVIKIRPGQSNNGLMAMFDSDEYKGKSIKELINMAMNSPQLTAEDQNYKKQIDEQLQGGGKLLHKSKELQYQNKPNPLDYAEQQQDEVSKQDFLYIELNAVRPQEGGLGYLM